MPRPTTKDELLEQIHTERRLLEETIAKINKRDMIKRGVTDEGWSVKDMLTHLVEWEQMFLRGYRAGLRGEVPHTPAPGMRWSWADMAILNRRIFEKHRRRRLDDVMADFRKSHKQAVKAAQSIAEEDLSNL
jgi:hypothetical protein